MVIGSHLRRLQAPELILTRLWLLLMEDSGFPSTGTLSWPKSIQHLRDSKKTTVHPPLDLSSISALTSSAAWDLTPYLNIREKAGDLSTAKPA